MEGHPESWNEELDAKCAALAQRSADHSNLLATKTLLEEEVQESMDAQWKVMNRRRQVSGRCGCPNDVVYTYTSQVAALYKQHHSQLAATLMQLHGLFAGPMFASLFELAREEQRLVEYVRQQEPALRDPAAAETLFRSLMSKVVGIESCTAFKDLLLTVGLRILSSGQGESARRQVLSTLTRGPGLAWAASLLRPTVHAIKEDLLHHILIAPAKQGFPLLEDDYIAYTSQIPWRELKALSKPEVEQYVLVPLQQAMEMAATFELFLLAQHIVKICAAVAAAYPSLLLTCVATPMRCAWPSREVAAAGFHDFPWCLGQRSDLLVSFCEVYQVYDAPLSALTGSALDEHRRVIAQYMVDNSDVSPSTPGSSLPVLRAIATLGLLWKRLGFQGEVDLASVVIGELFYFAFMKMDYLDSAAQALLRKVAQSLLKDVVEDEPVLVGNIVQMFGFQLPQIDVKEVVTWVGSADLTRWKVDEGSLHCLAFLLTNKSAPSLSDIAGLSAPEVVRMWREAILLKRNAVEMNVVTGNGVCIGGKMLEVINWALVPAGARVRALMSLISAAPFVEKSWLWGALLSPAAQQLAAAPMPFEVLSPLLEIRPQQGSASELLLVQLQLRLGLAASRDTGRAQCLEDQGFFADLLRLASFGSVGATMEIWARTTWVLQGDDRGALLLGGFLDKMVREYPETLEEAKARFTTALMIEEDHATTLQFRVQMLANYALKHPGLADLLNILVYGVFARQDPMDPVAMGMSKATTAWTSSDVEKFIATEHVWVAYAIIFTFKPLLPTSKEIYQGLPPTKKDMETAFWRFRGAALKLGANELALPFWEQFFVLYFEGQGMQPGFFANKDARDELNEHFKAVAKRFEVSNKNVYKLYFGLTTWSSDVIPARGLLFSSPELQLMSLFTPRHGPPFQVRPGSRIPLDQRAPSPPPDMAPWAIPTQDEEVERTCGKFSTSEIANEETVCDDNGEGGQADHWDVTVASLSDLLAKIRDDFASLRGADEELLALCKQLLYNHPAPFQVRVACETTTCVSPALLEVPATKIGPAAPNVRERIAGNRESFDVYMSRTLESARALARALNQLELMVDSLAESEQGAAGAQLFLEMLPLSLDGDDSLANLLVPAFAQIMDKLAVFVARNTNFELQATVLKLICSAPPSTTIERNRSYLFRALTPNAFLERGDRASFARLLHLLSQSKLQMSSREQDALAALFDVNGFLCGATEDSMRAGELPSLMALVTPLLANSGTAHIGEYIADHCMMVDYPAHVLPVVRVLLRGAAYSNISVASLEMLSRVPLDQIDSKQLLLHMSSDLPLPSDVMPTVIAAARRAILDPTFILLLSAENDALLEEKASPSGVMAAGNGGDDNDESGDDGDDGQRSGSVQWVEVERFFWAALKPFVSPVPRSGPRASFLSAHALGMLLDLMVEVVDACPSCINRIWYLYADIIAPFLQHSEFGVEDVASFLQALPWHSAAFHFMNPKALLSMREQLASDNWMVVPMVFARLDWELFFVSVKKEVRGRALAHFLQLLVDINLVAPEAVPPHIKASVGMRDEPEVAAPEERLAVWDMISVVDVANTFDGTNLRRLLLDGRVPSADPTMQLMQNAFLLYDVVSRVSDALCALAVVREVSSLILLALRPNLDEESGPPAYWHVPASRQLLLVSSILVPLTLKSSAHPAASSQMLMALLDAVTEVSPAVVVYTPTEYVYVNASCGFSGSSKKSLRKFKELSDKIFGVFLHFCSSAAPALCLEVLNTVWQGNLSVAKVVLVVEHTLRAFYTASTDRNPRNLAAGSLQLPELHWTDVVTASLAGKAGCALLCVLDQQRRSVADAGATVFVDVACQVVMVASRFEAAEGRDFDLLPLWFFALEVVADDRFHGAGQPGSDVYAALVELRDALAVFATTSSKLGTMFRRGPAPAAHSPSLVLGARASLTYLERLVEEKQMFKDNKVFKGSQPTLRDLQKLRTQVPYNTPQYSAFFSSAGSLLSATFSIEDLKRTVASLVPIVPYMDKL